METREAELIYEAGREAVVKALLDQDARIAALARQILELEQKISSLSTNSTNSSKPPSSDGPQVDRPKKKKSSRSRGGQKGHIGHKRDLLPVEEMDQVYHHYPPVCEQCGTPLAPENCEEPSVAERYQTFELPKIKPLMEEHCCHELRCSCGHRTRAELPAEVARSQFGPAVHGAIGYLTSVHRIGRRGIVEIMNTLFGLNLSLGTVANCLERLNPELEPVCEQARQTLTQADHINADETGWKCQGRRRYLWVFKTPLVVYFCIAASRGAKVLKAVLGDTFNGIITSDDHSAYSCYHKNGLRQLCWAHLIRKFKALVEIRGSPDAGRFAKHMLQEIERIFTCWHAFREGFINRQELLHATTLMRARMKRYCLAYQNSSDALVCTRARRTLHNWQHLFTFLTFEGVDPTNNAAEVRFVDHKPILIQDWGTGPEPERGGTPWLENLILV